MTDDAELMHRLRRAIDAALGLTFDPPVPGDVATAHERDVYRVDRLIEALRERENYQRALEWIAKLDARRATVDGAALLASTALRKEDDDGA